MRFTRRSHPINWSLCSEISKQETFFDLSTQTSRANRLASLSRITSSSTGICIRAESKKDLLQGFVTLLDRITLVDTDDYKPRHARTHTAALMRKGYFVNGDSRKAGWGKFEIGTLW